MIVDIIDTRALKSTQPSPFVSHSSMIASSSDSLSGWPSVV